MERSIRPSLFRQSVLCCAQVPIPLAGVRLLRCRCALGPGYQHLAEIETLFARLRGELRALWMGDGLQLNGEPAPHHSACAVIAVLADYDHPLTFAVQETGSLLGTDWRRGFGAGRCSTPESLAQTGCSTSARSGRWLILGGGEFLLGPLERLRPHSPVECLPTPWACFCIPGPWIFAAASTSSCRCPPPTVGLAWPGPPAAVWEKPTADTNRPQAPSFRPARSPTGWIALRAGSAKTCVRPMGA